MAGMSMLRWFQSAPEEQLGVPVHGPVVLARSPEVVVALESVVAFPEALRLRVVIRAAGASAKAAVSSRGWNHREAAPIDEASTAPLSAPRILVTVDGITGVAESSRGEASAGADIFDYRHDHWVGHLPSDGRLVVTVSWPKIGLAEATTELTLDSLDQLSERVVTIRPE